MIKTLKDTNFATNGIEIVLLDLKSEGCYIPSLKTIFIKGAGENAQNYLIFWFFIHIKHSSFDGKGDLEIHHSKQFFRFNPISCF